MKPLSEATANAHSKRTSESSAVSDHTAGGFESLLAELAVGFAGVAAESLDDAVRRALARAVSVLGVDVGLVIETVGEGRLMRTRHVVAGAGRDLELPEFLDTEFPWLAKRVARGDEIRLGGLDALPSDAAADRKALARRDVRSAIMCPVVADGAAMGAVAFFSTVREPGGLDRLHLVARMLAGALARRRLEQRLADETEFSEAVIQSMPGLLFILDEQGRLVRWNRSHETVLGYSAAELRGLHYSAYTAAEDHAASEEALERALRYGSVASVRHHVVSKDGRRIPYLAIGRGISMGGRRYGVGMAMDISALKAAEDQVRQQHAELAHVARVSAMGELVAAIAHELNQPLTAIRTNAQVTRRMLAQHHADAGELEEALVDITADAVRAGEIIRRLRDLLRKGDAERVSLDVNELIRGVEPFARADVLEQNGVLVMQLADGLPRVAGDRIQLQQVVLNLVRNGSEAMRDTAAEPRELVVTTALGGAETIEVTVRDSGPPLPDEDFARMFQPFYTTKPGGLGIGLSLSRSIIEAHGGLLWATRNAPDDGLTMHFTLRVEHARAG